MAVRALLLLACLSVAACADFPQQLGAREPVKEVKAPEPRYCYKTIGKVNCYSQPLDGSESNRLVGYDGPAPRPSAGTGPLSP